MTVLETDRLRLRELEPADLDVMVRLWTDPDVAAFMGDFGPRTPEDVALWLPDAIEASTTHPRHRSWAIVLRSTESVVGWISVGASSRPIGDIDFAFVVARAHRGHGYAAEALGLAVRFSFETLGARSFWGECDAANGASAAAMRRAGLKFIGTVDGSHQFFIENVNTEGAAR